jgi:predicted DCC family thiol-disulfide oxidoreductase YuxK
VRPPPNTVPDPSIVLFDGVCNFCDRSVQLIIRRDPKGHFKFAPLQSETGRKLLAQHGLDPQYLESLVLIENGGCYLKSDGALRIARRLSGPWQALWLFRIFPKVCRDWVYDFVVRNRYRWFGKKDQCVVPTPEMRERFIG